MQQKQWDDFISTENLSQYSVGIEYINKKKKQRTINEELFSRRKRKIVHNNC